jgi:hypothetical protein
MSLRSCPPRNLHPIQHDVLVTEDPDRVRIGTAEREEAMTRADLEPIFAELPAKPGAAWLAWLALPILGILLYR